MSYIADKSSEPDHLIDPRQKNKDWILKCVKHYYSDYNSSRWESLYFKRDKYETINDYANARQSISKYRESMEVDESSNNVYYNFDYTPLPIYNKLRSTALGLINKSGFNILATPIDGLAMKSIDEYFKRLEGKIKIRQELEKIDPSIIQGSPVDKVVDEPDDLDELKIHRLYQYKHHLAQEIEESIDVVMLHNDFQEIREQYKEDIFDYGVGGVKEYIDSNGAIRIRRVDTSRMITSYCEKKDFSDARYMGEIIRMTIADLKQDAGDQFSSTEYEHISKEVAKKTALDKSSRLGSSYNVYDDRDMVEVLDIEFYSVDEYVYENGMDRRGNRHTSRANYNKSGDNYKRIAAKVVYKAKWIVGTKYIYNAGLCTDMKRSRSMLQDTSFSYHLYAPNMNKMRIMGLTERMIPIIDQLQLAWLKLQQAIAEARPKGIAIDISGVLDAAASMQTKAGKALTPYDIIDLYDQKGILVYSKLDANGNVSNYRPIEELNNGIGDEAARWFSLIQAKIDLMRDSMGLNQLTDSSTPDPRTLTSIAQMAYESTNNALYQYAQADREIFKSITKALVLRLQTLARTNRSKIYYSALGENTFRLLKLSKNLSNHEFGIKIENKPDEQQRQMLIARLEKFQDTGLIDFEDVMLIENTDNLKAAQAILAYKIKKRKKELQQQEIENQQRTFQGQAQSAQVAEQSKQQTLQLEYQLKMQLVKLEKEYDMAIKQLEMGGKGEIEALRKSVDADIAAGKIESEEYQTEILAKARDERIMTEMDDNRK